MATASGDSDKVNTTGVEYNAMSTRWPLLVALMGGTQAMRDAEKTYLAQMKGENPEDYNLRLGSSFLFPGFRDAIRQLIAKPFSREVALKETPTWVDNMEDDVDGLGRSLTSFARDVFQSGITYGVTHILVDADKDSDRTNFVHVPASRLIGWRQDDAGDLSQIRIREVAIVPDGLYGDRTVNRVRVYEPNEWRLFEQREVDSEYEQVDQGLVSLGRIPLVSYYTDRTGFLTADPPLEELAWVNLDHWQSYSDQRNILKFSRFAMRYVFGLDIEEQDDLGVIGPTTTIKSSSPDAQAGYIEPTGGAIGAGREHLQDLQATMQAMSLRPMVERSGDVTATEKAIDEARADTDLQAWIRGLEHTLISAFEVAGDWMSEKLPEKFVVDISNEFSVSAGDAATLDALAKARGTRDISQETFLREYRRLGVLHEATDIEAEIELTENEPVPGMEVTSGPT